MRFGLPILGVILAVGARRLLDQVLGLQAPYALVVMTVLVTATKVGFRPALVAAVLGGLLTVYFIQPPRGSFVLTAPQTADFVLYLFTTIGISVMGGVLHGARAAAEARATETTDGLRQSQAMLQLVLDNIPQGVFWKDRESRHLGCNLVVARALGYKSPAEIVGLSDEDFPTFTAAQAAFFKQKDTEVMDANAPQRNIVEPMTRPDGSTAWLNTNKVPMHRDGQVVGILGTWEDITERRQSEELLRASEQRFHRTLNEMLEGCQIIGFDWRYVYLNDAALRHSRRAHEDLLGRTMMECYPGIEQTEVFRNIQQCMVERVTSHLENRFVYSDGTSAWFELSIQPAPDGVFILSIDITERKLAEDALRASEERLRLATDAAGMGTWERNLKSQELRWSVGLERLMGLEPGTFPGTYAAFEDFVHPDDHGRLEEARRGREQGGDYRVEIRFKLAKGDIRWALIRGQLLRDADGRPDRLVGIQMDITDQKRAEEELEENQRRLRMALAAAQIGDWELDLVTRKFRRSPQHDQIFGHDSRLDWSFNELLDQVHPDDRFRVKQAFSRALASGQDWSLECRIIRSDSETRWIWIRGSFFKNEAGAPVRIIGMLGDITDSKHADALRQAVVGADIGTWHWDVVKDELHWSDQCKRLFGIPLTEEMSYERFLLSLHPDDRERADSAVKVALATRGDYEIEFRTLWPDGSLHWAVSKGRGYYDGNGKLLRMEGAALDITRRKHAEEQVLSLNAALEERAAEVQEANKELEAFSYSVSHDLRAPLRAVDGFSRIVVEDFAGEMPAEAREYLQDIRANAQKMGRLVDDLLAFSRLNRQPLRKVEVPTCELVQQCLDELQSADSRIQVQVHLGDLPPCQADPALLKQVWLNLLSNAFKYSAKSDPSRIEIGTQNPGAGIEAATYYVRDNGVGFDMRYAHKLFGVFQRLHRAEEYEGTGVGLAIVQRIIHRHGGRVWAESAPQAGTTFFFTLSGEGLPDGEQRRNPAG